MSSMSLTAVGLLGSALGGIYMHLPAMGTAEASAVCILCACSARVSATARAWRFVCGASDPRVARMRRCRALEAGPEFSEQLHWAAELSSPGMDTWTAGVAGQWPARGACADAGALGAGKADLGELPDSAKPPGTAVSEITERFVTNLLRRFRERNCDHPTLSR